ncbi:hypothetical protein CJ177_46075 [Rhodococcus sp. ACPA1]|nr:hypothetical protein CJ177_46075 [Rhodococcus sp. ACPA1]
MPCTTVAAVAIGDAYPRHVGGVDVRGGIDGRPGLGTRAPKGGSSGSAATCTRFVARLYD